MIKLKTAKIRVHSNGLLYLLAYICIVYAYVYSITKSHIFKNDFAYDGMKHLS